MVGNQDFLFDVDIQDLFLKAKKEKIPFNKWYFWIQV